MSDQRVMSKNQENMRVKRGGQKREEGRGEEMVFERKKDNLIYLINPHCD